MLLISSRCAACDVRLVAHPADHTHAQLDELVPWGQLTRCASCADLYCPECYVQHLSECVTDTGTAEE